MFHLPKRCANDQPTVRTNIRPSISTGNIRRQEVSNLSAAHGDHLELKRRKSARDLFEQYGIARPTGWLSDEEDLSLSGDRNASPRRFCRICHVCSALTASPTHCSACGHRLCEQCVCEVSGNSVQGHREFSQQHSPANKRDGNAAFHKLCRVCHVCSTRTWSSTNCSACGHRLYQRCVCEVPGNSIEGHREFSHHPSPTIQRDGARYVQPTKSTLAPLHHSQQHSQESDQAYVREQSQQADNTERHVAVQTENDEYYRNNPPQRTSSISRQAHTKMTARNTLASHDHKQSRLLPKPEMHSSSTEAFGSLRTRPTWSVKENPFLIADNMAKGKDTAPQASNHGCGESFSHRFVSGILII
jgi:hypothetical protein